MTISCEVLEEVTESFVGKRGPQTVPLWICLDRSPEGRLRNTFDYEVNADEQEKFGAKAGGKNVEIIVTEIRIGFGNRRQCPEDHGSGLLNGFHALAQKIGDPDLAVRRAGRPELPLSEMACLRQLAARPLCPMQMAAGTAGKEK